LRVGQQLAFKAWWLVLPLRIAAVVLGIGVALGGAVAAWHWRHAPLVTVGGLAMLAISFAITAIVGKRIMRVVNFGAEMRRILRALLLTFGGFLLARLHLWIFNPLFLRAGSIEQLSTPSSRLNLRRFRSILSFVVGALVFIAATTWRTQIGERLRAFSQLVRQPTAENQFR
jgi:hypothetical protein